MLNGRELYDKGIITEVEEENLAQHGIDLNVISIQKMSEGSCGVIPRKGNTILASKVECPPHEISVGNATEGFSVAKGWKLAPGMYDVVFKQGCSIPNDMMLLIRQRSSLLRNGALLHSSVFDAGFETSNIGTMLYVTHPIVIEEGARICQIYGHATTPIQDEDLYEGQFQNDKQRQ